MDGGFPFTARLRQPPDRGRRGDGDGREPSLIACYERIANASHSMLEAACDGDWKRFEQIADQCHGLIDALREASLRGVLSEAERQRRMALLREILRDDARIRAHAEPWLRDLDQFLA